MAFGGGGESYCVSAIIAGAGEMSCYNRAHIMYNQHAIQHIHTQTKTISHSSRGSEGIN